MQQKYNMQNLSLGDWEFWLQTLYMQTEHVVFCCEGKRKWQYDPPMKFNKCFCWFKSDFTCTFIYKCILYNIPHVLFLESDDLTKVDVPSLKQMYTSLVTLVLEAVKTDCDNGTIRSVSYIVIWIRADLLGYVFMSCTSHYSLPYSCVLPCHATFPHHTQLLQRVATFHSNC